MKPNVNELTDAQFRSCILTQMNLLATGATRFGWPVDEPVDQDVLVSSFFEDYSRLKRWEEKMN